MKKFNLIYLATLLIALLIVPRAHADSLSVNFEPSTYTVGNINGQDGWSSTGPYDQSVVTSPVISGAQSFRISNAVTSSSFGDHTFSKSLVNEAGETSAQNNGLSGGTRQSYFEASWDFKSTSPSAEQPGLAIVASPDRGDGARMSWVQMKDTPSGLEVNFFDYQSGAPDTGSGVGFVLTNVASGLDRSTTHNIKITMQFVDGVGNDIVKVYVDGVLKHTGESWEDYFREQESTDTRTVDSVLFRAGGTPAPATSGNGFLIDNLSLMSGPIVLPTVKVTIDKFIGNSMATAITANSSAFPMTATWNATNIGAGSGSFVLGTTGHNSANAYEAITSDMTVGADYTTSEVTSGPVVGADCTTGKPYALDGYTSGDTLAAAQAATKSNTAPNFTNLQNDKFIIVWNKVCEEPTPTPIPNLPVACAGMTITNVITGTNGSEVLNGTSGNDFINGVGGSDVINGAGGNDCILAGNGSSVLNGGAGNDVIVAGNANDTANGGADNDKIWGNGGSDYLAGGAGTDELRGGDGSDVLSGQADNDMLFGDGGSDLSLGGAGSDTCIAEVKTSCEL